MTKVFLLAFLLVVKPALSQVDSANENLKAQAALMAKALIEEDYKTFFAYNYKPLVVMMGGEEKMEALIKKSIDEWKEQGIFLDSVSFAAVSDLIKIKKEIQGTIVQNLFMKTPRGTISSSSSLIAISHNNGSTWTFLGTTGQDLQTIRKQFPELSPELKLMPPKPAGPVTPQPM